MENPLINTSKEEKKVKKLDRRHEREMSDIRFILKSPEGRRFYHKILAKGKVFVDPFCNDNTNGTNYNLGRQSISRDFLNDLLEAKPDGLQQIMQEKAAEEESDRLQDEFDRQQNGGLI